MSAGFRFVGGPADGELRWLPGDPPSPVYYLQELPPLRFLPVDENTVDVLDKTITDLRDHMNGMRDKAEAQDTTVGRLHRELAAARAEVREADERVRTANLCIKYAKSHISGIASADALRGLRKRLQKSLKNV